MSNGTLDERILEFARSELGPASELHLREGAMHAAVLARLESGKSLADAVLAEIHALIGRDRRVADEFAAHFIFDLMRIGRLSMSSTSRLRRFLDTGDLVLSVFGDLWGDLTALEFESADQFKALFAQRLNWKATDEARRLNAPGRREDRRLAHSPEELDLAGSDPDAIPLSRSIRQEEKERLILLLLRMKERDRLLLSLHLRGESLPSIAQQMGSTLEATRKALARAIGQARQLAADSEARDRTPLT